MHLIFHSNSSIHLCSFSVQLLLVFYIIYPRWCFNYVFFEKFCSKMEYPLPFPLDDTFLIQAVVRNPLPPARQQPLKPIMFVLWLILSSFTYAGNAWNSFTFSKRSWLWSCSSVWESRMLLTSTACLPSRGPCVGWLTSQHCRVGAHILLSRSHSKFVWSTCRGSWR